MVDDGCRRKGILISLVLLLAMVCVALAPGCSPPRRVSTYSHPGMSKARLEKIGVVPFVKGRHPTNVRQTLSCNLCQLAFDPASVFIGAENTLTRYVHNAMAARYGNRVLPSAEVSRVYKGLRIDEAKETGASLLVSGCPRCDETFKKAMAARGIEDIKVVNLVELVARAAGIN